MLELTEFHCDALKESMNIGVAQAASVLSTLIDSPVDLHIPKIQFVELTTLRSHLDGNYKSWGSCVVLNFDGGLKGDGVLVFSLESAQYLISLISKEQFGGEIMPEMESDLLLELGNIVVNSCIGSIANLLDAETTDGFPRFCSRAGSEIFDELLEEHKRDSFGMIISTDMKVEGTDLGLDLIVCFDASSMDFVIERLMALVA